MPYYLFGTVAAAFDEVVQRATAALKDEGFGVLLPCNVIVRDAGDGKTEFAAIDPVASMDRTGNPELAAMAEEVRARLPRAVERV